MKKIITLLILFCSVAFAQDVNTTVSQAYKDTLTSTIDTVVVRFNAKFDYYTLAFARTSSGTDTVIVQTASFGETYWTTRALVDLSTGDYITSLYVTTTAKEYIIADSDVRAIRLITADGSAASEFMLAGRKGTYIQGNSVVLTTINASLDNIEADADSTVDMVTSMNTSLDNIEADADSTVDMVTAIHGDLDTVEEKLDSLDASSTRIESKLDDANAGIDSLDASSTRIEGYVDGVEAKLDSIDASSTRIEGKIDNTNTKLDSIEVTVNNIESKVATEAKQDTMEVSLNAIQSAVGTSNSTLDSLEVTANAIQTAVGTTNTKLDSLDASNTRIEGYVDGLESQLAGSTNNYSTTFTTAGTTIDSVAFGFTTREYTFVNDGVVTDTLYISSASDFPATNTSKLVGLEWQTKRRAVTKLYFKVGATPLASKKIRIEAN